MKNPRLKLIASLVGLILLVVILWKAPGANPDASSLAPELARAPRQALPTLPPLSTPIQAGQTLPELHKIEIPSPGLPCKQDTQEMLLPVPTTTPARFIPTYTGVPGKPVVLDSTQLSQRAGFSISTNTSAEIWAEKLHSGWLLSWSVMLRSSDQLPLHWQMIRLKPGCFYPSIEYIRWVAAQFPGNVWIIGNEPDVIWQDNVTPEEYAYVYHELYNAIKSADPTAKIATAGISQATSLRLEYLDRVLAEYQIQYSTHMPVDWWTVHGYVLREERKSWGVDIPPGMTQNRGELREVSDHGRMDLFKKQINDFRSWMAMNGYRDTPLALTEFGILMPLDYGFSMEVVAQYLQESFAWLQNAKDEKTGYSQDENRLVQRWAWFSLADALYPSSDLADLRSGELTELGCKFRDYVLKYKP